MSLGGSSIALNQLLDSRLNRMGGGEMGATDKTLMTYFIKLDRYTEFLDALIKFETYRLRQ